MLHRKPSDGILGYGTQVISAVISNNNLNGIGQRIGLGAHIRMNKGALGYVSEVMMATALEAVLGAIWLEGGSEAVRPSLRKLGLLRAVASTTEEGLSMPASMPDIFQTKLSLIDNVDEEHVPEL
jgi:dsRNA-specific ribonuclease